MRHTLRSLLPCRPPTHGSLRPGRQRTSPSPVRIVVVIVLTLTAACTAAADPALAGCLAALAQAGTALWTALRSPAVPAPAHAHA
jgi:hypothetical protein